MRHAQHYVAIAAEAESEYLAGGEKVIAGLAHFDRERVNLDSARQWLQSQATDTDTDADILLIAEASKTAHIGELRYSIRTERIPQLEQALNAAIRQRKRIPEGTFLGNLGSAYYVLGETRRAINFYQKHLALATELNDRPGQAAALGNLGNSYADLGDPHTAIKYYEQHLVLARELGDRRGEATALGNLGVTFADIGETQMAIRYYEQHLSLARELGDRRREGIALGNLGLAYLDLEDSQRAIKFHQQRLDIARELGDRRGEGNALGNLGLAYATLGDISVAIDFYQQRLAIARELGDRRGEGVVLGNLGTAYRKLGQVQVAIDFYQQRLMIAQELGDRRGEASALGNLGNIYYTQRDLQTAADFYQQSLSTSHVIGDRRSESNALRNLGLVYEDLGEAVRAINFYRQWLAIAETIDDRRSAAEAMWKAGQLLAREGEREQALLFLKDSLAYYQSVNHSQAYKIAEAIARLQEGGTFPGERPTLPGPLAGLPTSVRQALESHNDAGLQAALAELSPQESQTIVVKLQQAGVISSEPDIGLLLREWEPLLRDIARVVRGDAEQRAEIEQVLAHLEQGGWMLREPVEHIWAGERDRAKLTAGLDIHDTVLVTRVLELVSALKDDRDHAHGISPRVNEGAVSEVQDLHSEIEQVVQRALPLLGDIALAALGDETARQIAEATLLKIGSGRGQLDPVVRSIWAGERDVVRLTTGLDDKNAVLVQRVLHLIAGDPTPIAVAGSRMLSGMRQRAQQLTSEVLASGDAEQRFSLAAQLRAAAIQTEQQHGAPWQVLGTELRLLAERLEQGARL